MATTHMKVLEKGIILDEYNRMRSCPFYVESMSCSSAPPLMVGSMGEK